VSEYFHSCGSDNQGEEEFDYGGKPWLQKSRTTLLSRGSEPNFTIARENLDHPVWYPEKTTSNYQQEFRKKVRGPIIHMVNSMKNG
jgi:hypothetical protein